MSEVTARVMVVVAAIKHAIVTGVAPGLSVNTHPNAFFLNVIGEIDLLRAAQAAITRLDQFDKDAAARLAAQQEKEPAKAVSEPNVGG